MFSVSAMTVLKTRYLLQGEQPEDMFWRVARHVAQAEERYGQCPAIWAEQYFNLMNRLDFLPNSPTLMNSGKTQGQLAACFVLPIEDSLTSIFDALKYAAMIHKSGGGTGFSFSRIRPKGDSVSGHAHQASGPTAFINIFDAATEVVKQGVVRRGANMAVLRVDHPDIEEFITVKQRQDVLNNFNLSVGITDAFMQAVRNRSTFDLVNPRNRQTVKAVDARTIFDLIARLAWENGEPGLFFLDTVNRANPTPSLGVFESPNPCSEQPLLPYESCTLGSINLKNMVSENAIDYERLRSIVRLAVRFLDSVIDVNNYPLEEIARKTHLTRKIGLGIMGLADLFILLDTPYASNEAVKITEEIMAFITREARGMSQDLARERGQFPVFNESVYVGQECAPLRNATVTTVAPTGSISLIAGCSAGIEPLFALATTRRVLDGQLLVDINPVVIDYLRQRGLLTAEVESQIHNEGRLLTSALPAQVKHTLATAHEIAPMWHVAHLAAAQLHTDNAVSKTVNLPAQARIDDVTSVFWQAYELGCKGVTVYRDGSRNQQVLTTGVTECEVCEN